ncbi:cytochrome c [soil metagenome]
MRGLIPLVVAIAACSATAEAGDPAAGKKKAAMCRACHGLDGLGKIPDAPNIAGQKETYLVQQLTAFKSGERKNEQMTIMAKTLSDEDIANVAAYYASIKITVQVPP